MILWDAVMPTGLLRWLLLPLATFGVSSASRFRNVYVVRFRVEKPRHFSGSIPKRSQVDGSLSLSLPFPRWLTYISAKSEEPD